MTLTTEHVANEFLAATEAAGLKKVTVQVGKLGEDTFLVTVSLQNPVARGIDDEVLLSSCPYEFVDREHIRETAKLNAAMFARAIPTIH